MPNDSLASGLAGTDGGVTRLWLLAPDRTLATIIDTFVDFEMNLEYLLTGSIKIKVAADHRMFGLSWGGVGILDHGMENWGCAFYYRDPGSGTHKKFIGIADPLKISHRGRRGTGYVDVEFNHAFWDLLRRRQVWTQYGARYENDDTPDNIARDLILKTCCDGYAITPDGNDTNRAQFGPAESPWSITCDLPHWPGDHPETLKYSCDHGTALTDALRELFTGRMPRTGSPTDIYPSFSENSPGAFHIDILCGKDLVTPRVIGRDLSGKSFASSESATILAPERETLSSYIKTWERTDQITSIEVRGRGAHREQRRFFISDPEMLARVGPIENSWTAPEAIDGDEMELEARTYLFKRREGIVAIEVGLNEVTGVLTYPDHIDLMDTVAVYSGKDTFDSLSYLDVVKVTVRIPVPGHPKVSVGLGQLQRNWLSEMGRHGGGRGGGGGGGGRPRQKSGSGAGGCDKAVQFIQDSKNEYGVGTCEGRVKFLGDDFISAVARLSHPQDNGLGQTDVVVELKWCAPECTDHPFGDGLPASPIAWAQICVGTTGGEVRGAVPVYNCDDIISPSAGG